MSLVLDLARIFAALAIFYYHVGISMRLPLYAEGEFAVTTFLLLAIAAAVAFSLPKRGGAELRPVPYLVARLTRLLPLYWCVNLAVYAISFVVPSQLGRPYTFGELMLSCLGLSGFFDVRFLSFVFWFVPFVIQVYILIAFGHAALLRLRAWWWTPVAFGLFWAMIQLAGAWCATPVRDLREYSPLFRPAELLLGVQGGLWLTGQLPGAAFARRVAIYAALAGALALVGRGVSDVKLAYLYSMPLNGLVVSVAVLTAAGAAAFLIGRRPAAAASRGWRLLGRATYPFYLIHGLAIASLMHRFGRPSAAVWVGYLVGCAVVALALDAIFSVRIFGARRR